MVDLKKELSLKEKNKYMKCDNNCKSCLMPFEKDPGVRESADYCSLCYKNGKLCYEGDLKGFQKVCYEQMRRDGMSVLKAKFFTFMIRFAPRWKKK